MVPNGYVHIHMLYPMVDILLLPLALLEYAAPGEEKPGNGLLHRLMSWVLLLALGLAAYSYWLTDNNAYLKADFAMRQCTAWSNRLVARIEDCPDYEPGMKVVLLGSHEREKALSPTPELELSRAQFEDPAALLLRLGRLRPELRLRLIPYRAVGTEGGLLLALRLDAVSEDGRPVPTRLAAFSPTELSDGGAYEALVQG